MSNAICEEIRTIRNTSLNIHKFEYQKRESRYCNNHWHAGLEINYYHECTGEIQINEIPQSISGNTVVLVNNKARHELHINPISSESYAIVLLIPYKLLNVIIPNFNEFFFDIDNHDTQLIELILNLYGAFGTDDEFLNLKTDELLFKLLYYLCSNYGHRTKAYSEIKNINGKDWAEAISKYVNANYNIIKSVDEVSSYFHYSREGFSRKFKNEFNCSFKTYITKLRTLQAVKLLRDSNKSYISISEECGFPNIRAFKDSILKYFGSEYTQIHDLPSEKYWSLLEQM